MRIITWNAGDTLSFPSAGIRLSIVENAVDNLRLSIESPPGVEPELCERGTGPAHDARNRLNAIAVGLHLSRRQRQAGLNADADASLDKAIEDLHRLSSEL